MGTSEALTRGVRVRVRSQYVPERSQPPQGEWFFTYSVRIANEGEEVAQLRTRHWIITDAEGEVQEVKGDGVVGAQPYEALVRLARMGGAVPTSGHGLPAAPR